MKWTRNIIIFAVASLAPCARAEVARPSESKREGLAERSGGELRQVRAQVDTTARRLPLAAQGRLAPIYDALSSAEQALIEWRTARDSEIPQLRARLEDATSKALRLWGDLQVDRRHQNGE